jgi:hypothetical protein
VCTDFCGANDHFCGHDVPGVSADTCCLGCSDCVCFRFPDNSIGCGPVALS